MSYLIRIVVVFAMLTGCAVLAGEKTVPSGKEREIRALIGRLVSPNPPAITGDEDPSQAPDYRLPPGYNREKQKEIYGIVHQLKQFGPAAFPALVENWEDRRYCRTVSDGLSGYCHNQTVGQVCRSIVYDQLQPYGTWPRVEDDPRGKPKRPSYPAAFLGSPENATAWCERNKHRSVYELQLGVINWVIQVEGQHLADFTELERAEVEGMRRKLLESKTPITRGNYYMIDVEE